IAATASVVPMIDIPIPASPQNSSSLTIGIVRPLGSIQNWAIPSNPYRPIFAASWITGQGVSSRSSHSCAAGRTTCSANPWTQSRMSLCSWLSSRLKTESGSPPPLTAAAACSAARSALGAPTPRRLHQLMSHASVSANGPTLPAVIEATRIRSGLWRWSTPHPEWRPDAAVDSPADWPREVGSVLCDAADATVLIDPLLPSHRERFLRGLDEHVGERGLPVAVLITIGFHRRSRDELRDRYRASTSRARKSLPAGVESFPVRGAGETLFWLAEHRALVPGDRIIGASGGGLRLCPE